jgi:putative ABC transport system substrate-binding protein
VGNAERARAYAAELVSLAPDVILANGTPALAALHRATRSIPVVFVAVVDPVGAGYVQSLARPGGDITGFSTFEPEIGSKWLELLKEAKPDLRRMAGILDPDCINFGGACGCAARRDQRARPCCRGKHPDRRSPRRSCPTLRR